MRRIQPATAGFEDEGGPGARECRRPLEAEKDLWLTASQETETPVLRLHGTELCQPPG